MLYTCTTKLLLVHQTIKATHQAQLAWRNVATTFSHSVPQIYKIEMPGEDPTVEIVCSFSDDNLAAPISTAVATATSSGIPAGKNHLSGSPAVKISSDGRKLVIERNPAADDGDGGYDGVAEQGRFRLQLPQRVVPTTAMSFFRKGELTVRATLTTSE